MEMEKIKWKWRMNRPADGDGKSTWKIPLGSATFSKKSLLTQRWRENGILLALSMFWSVLAFAEIIFNACHAMHRCMRSIDDSHPGTAPNSKRRIVHGSLH
jgi:hypothetical protein